MYYIAVWLEKLFYLITKQLIKLFILFVLIICLLLILQHFNPEEATKPLDADNAIGGVTLLIFSTIIAFILWIVGLYFYHSNLSNNKEKLNL
jgi:cytochrome c oxidase assembly factor CtaG